MLTITVSILIGVGISTAILLPQLNNLIKQVDILVAQVETIPYMQAQITTLEKVNQTQYQLIIIQNNTINGYIKTLETDLDYIHSIQKLLEIQKYQTARLEKSFKILDPTYVPTIDYDKVYGNLTFDQWWDLNKNNILFKR
ncbi:hypothetical protein FJY84_09260 [Candidatus Bathyarchaeota archaeon]|nr:hypothetical protein [Candidatus Bathyarchaeota archaeon]